MRPSKREKLSIGLLWAQFGAYHVDRCRVTADRLAGRAEVLAVEVAASSRAYAWETSGATGAATKKTLFPALPYEDLGFWSLLWKQFQALRKCSHVFVGIGYNQLDVIALAAILRLRGASVYMMTDSKFDDAPRWLPRELGKMLLLSVFSGAIVAGPRQAHYVRSLGFHRRPVFPGYDAVDLERVRNDAISDPAMADLNFNERPFVFVGRFVSKKNLLTLIDAYAMYTVLTNDSPRRLVLVGGGELEDALRARVRSHDLDDYVEFAGFLNQSGVAAVLSSALALVLPSAEEQWGLVVNEAAAFHLPLMVSDLVGAREALVRNYVNGFILEAHSVEGWAQAMLQMTRDESVWRAMRKETGKRAWLADSPRFADAIECAIFTDAPLANANVARFWEACASTA